MTKKILIKQLNNPKEDYKMNKITLSFISCLLLVAINTNLQAQCTWTTQAAGAWTDAATWTNDGGMGCSGSTPSGLIPSGTTVIINHQAVTNAAAVVVSNGATLTVNSSAELALNGNLLIQSGGTANITDATVKDNSGTGYSIINNGTLNIDGCLAIEGSMGFNNNSTVNETGGPSAIFIRNTSATVSNSGTWTGVEWWQVGGGGSGPAGLKNETNTRSECAATIPVELSYFGAQATIEGVMVKWTTESETENLGFVLERKTDTTEWAEIASYKTNDALLGQGSVEYATDYEYVDSFVEVGETYEYRLGDVDYAGTVTYHAARSVTVTTAPLAAKVEHFTVLAAYPNPFNPSTTLRYALPQTEANYTTTVQIYDLTGKLVKTLLSEQQPAGWHSVVWHGTDQFGSRVPAGVYLSKVSFGSETKTIKVMLLK